MAYSTPHHAREFLAAASLAICHDYVLRCQRRSASAKRQLLEATREIDLCGRLAAYFGPPAHLAAQGAPVKTDLVVAGPTIRAEVKYFRKRVPWANARPDWDWLLAAKNVGEEFRKRAWVVFWPSSSLYTFPACLSVPKTHGQRYSLLDFAPFSPYAEPELPANGANQRLKFKTPPRASLLSMPQGKRVRVDIIGARTDPLWCCIYTRVTPDEATTGGLSPIQITNNAIEIDQ